MERKIIDMNIYKNLENITNLDLEIFQQILDENVSEAVLKSLGQFFALKMDDGDDYDSINEEMYDVTIPADLEKTLKEINRNKYEESYITDDVSNITENAESVVKENSINGKCITRNLFNSERNSHRAKQLSKTVALLLLIITLTFGTFAPQTQAMRFKLYNIFINENKGNADVVISKNTDSNGLYYGANKPEEVVEEITELKLIDYFDKGTEIPYPSYLPEGCKLIDVNEDKMKVSLVFSTGNNDFISLFIYKEKDFKVNVDMEKSENKTFLMENKDAFISENEVYYSVHWICEGRTVVLRMNKEMHELDILIKIAESISIKKI